VLHGWAPPLDPAPRLLVLLALAGGVVLDLGLRGGLDNAVVLFGVGVFVLALVTNNRLESAQARWLATGALVPALFLAVWSSPWLIMSNLAVIAVLFGIAIVQARSGSVLDTTPLRLLRRSAAAVLRAAIGPAALRKISGRISKDNAAKLVRIGWALLVAVPLLAIIVALLASADAVFASFVAPDVDAGPLVGHIVVAGLIAFFFVCVVASALGDSGEEVPAGRFGVLEVTTMLGLTVAVLGLFSIAQLVALTGAGERLVKESGLTPAEYARTGFFQLCWAAAFLLILLALVRTLAVPEAMKHPTVRGLAAAVPVLALGLVVVSLQRMRLYDEAFGLTMLRLWVVGAALWMGALLVMIALHNAGVGRQRNWVFGGAVAAGCVLVLCANVGNPEAFVVRHNVARAEDGARLDGDYLAGLSDDAVPALVGALDRMPILQHDIVVNELRCQEDAIGAAALNVSAKRAADARASSGILPYDDDSDERYANCGYRYHGD
jgi:hypothetical protein